MNDHTRAVLTAIRSEFAPGARFVASPHPDVEDDKITVTDRVHVQCQPGGTFGVVADLGDLLDFYPTRTTPAEVLADLRAALEPEASSYVGVVRTDLLVSPYDRPRPERIAKLEAAGVLPGSAQHVERVERRAMMLEDYQAARPSGRGLTAEEFAELALCQSVLLAFENAEHPRRAVPIWPSADDVVEGVRARVLGRVAVASGSREGR